MSHFSLVARIGYSSSPCAMRRRVMSIKSWSLRMVVPLPLRLAERQEVAEWTVRDGKRVGVEPLLHEGEKPSANAAEVSGELGRPVGVANPGPEHDVHPRRLEPLNAHDLLGVEAELEDVVRLRVPSQLRVGDLVTAGR